MEITVTGTVFVEVGPKTMAILTGVTNVKSPKTQDVSTDVKIPQETEQAKEQKTRTSTKQAVTEDTTKEKTGSSFADLDDEAKLEAIKAEVTRHTKNRKGADIKWMLAQFNASSVSKIDPIDPKDYDAFYNAIMRYGAGEALTDIFPSDLM